MFAGLLTGVTTWFKAPLNIAIAVVFGLLFGELGTQWVEKLSAERKVETLNAKVETLSGQLAAANMTISMKTLAIAALEKAKKDEEVVTSAEQQIKQEVYNAPSNDDAPVAPVLRRSVDGVARMLNHGR